MGDLGDSGDVEAADDLEDVDAEDDPEDLRTIGSSRTAFFCPRESICTGGGRQVESAPALTLPSIPFKPALSSAAMALWRSSLMQVMVLSLGTAAFHEGSIVNCNGVTAGSLNEDEGISV